MEWPVIPLSLGVGVLIISYAGTLRASVAPLPADDDPESDADGVASDRTKEIEPLLVLQRIALAAIVVVTLFWTVAVFAQLEGLQTAERIAANPQSLPGVVVFAPRRLQLNGSSVLETTLPPEPDPLFRYRYDGFRLLTRSDKRLSYNTQRPHPAAATASAAARVACPRASPRQDPASTGSRWADQRVRASSLNR